MSTSTAAGPNSLKRPCQVIRAAALPAPTPPPPPPTDSSSTSIRRSAPPANKRTFCHVLSFFRPEGGFGSSSSSSLLRRTVRRLQIETAGEGCESPASLRPGAEVLRDLEEIHPSTIPETLFRLPRNDPRPPPTHHHPPPSPHSSTVHLVGGRRQRQSFRGKVQSRSANVSHFWSDHLIICSSQRRRRVFIPFAAVQHGTLGRLGPRGPTLLSLEFSFSAPPPRLKANEKQTLHQEEEARTS